MLPEPADPALQMKTSMGIYVGGLYTHVQQGTRAYSVVAKWSGKDYGVEEDIVETMFKWMQSPSSLKQDFEVRTRPLPLSLDDALPLDMFKDILSDMLIFHKYYTHFKYGNTEYAFLKPYVSMYLRDHPMPGYSGDTGIMEAFSPLPLLAYLMDGHNAFNTEFANLRTFLEDCLPSPAYLRPLHIVEPPKKTATAMSTSSMTSKQKAVAGVLAAGLLTAGAAALYTHRTSRRQAKPARVQKKPVRV